MYKNGVKNTMTPWIHHLVLKIIIIWLSCGMLRETHNIIILSELINFLFYLKFFIF